MQGEVLILPPSFVEKGLYFFDKWFHGDLNFGVLASTVTFAESFAVRDPSFGGEVNGFGYIESVAES